MEDSNVDSLTFKVQNNLFILDTIKKYSYGWLNQVLFLNSPHLNNFQSKFSSNSLFSYLKLKKFLVFRERQQILKYIKR
jgi:hypothetical protein